MNKRRELYREMGERLREYRNQFHYTQEQTAELLDMSLAYYGRVERGINGLSLEKLLLAYKKMDIDPTYLITGDMHREITFEGLLKDCPRDKQYEMEQLVTYAMKIAKK